MANRTTPRPAAQKEMVFQHSLYGASLQFIHKKVNISLSASVHFGKVNKSRKKCSAKSIKYQADFDKFFAAQQVQSFRARTCISLLGNSLHRQFLRQTEPNKKHRQKAVFFVWWRLTDSPLIAATIINRCLPKPCHFVSCLWNSFRVRQTEPNKKHRQKAVFFVWWRLTDSNCRPHACEACALTS